MYQHIYQHYWVTPKKERLWKYRIAMILWAVPCIAAAIFFLAPAPSVASATGIVKGTWPQETFAFVASAATIIGMLLYAASNASNRVNLTLWFAAVLLSICLWA